MLPSVLPMAINAGVPPSWHKHDTPHPTDEAVWPHTMLCNSKPRECAAWWVRSRETAGSRRNVAARPGRTGRTRPRRRSKNAVVRLLTALAALCLGVLLPASAQARPFQGSSGCHVWSPVFRPILGVLGAGQIEVALPTYLPPLGPHVFVHASIDQPPKSFRVTLTTSSSGRIAKTSVLLVIHGNAGNHLPRLKPRPAAQVHGKPLYAGTDAYRFAGLSWFHRSGGITYTVAAPAFIPLFTLLRIAGSLVPAPLRRTPITTGSGHFPPPCP